MQEMERVGRSRHRRCDPGRAHRLLHPRFVESASLRQAVAPDYPINRLGDEKVKTFRYSTGSPPHKIFNAQSTEYPQCAPRRAHPIAEAPILAWLCRQAHA